MKISIIIPVYNKQRYIDSILWQICEQSFQDYECLLIDDGSTDGSGAICDAFAKKDEHFQVYHISNSGVSHARNVGLDAAKGEYITFIDADDGIHPYYLENLLDCIQSSGADIVISGHKKIWADNLQEITVLPEHRGMKCFQDIVSSFSSEQKKTGIWGFCCSKIFSKNLISDLRFDENLRLAEDLDFYLRLYERIRTVYFDDKPYYYYLQAAENSTGNIPSDKIDYVAQLRINLHYRSMLQARRAFFGENEQIVSKLLNDYVFFSLRYCPYDLLRERFQYLVQFCRENNVQLYGQGALKSILFWSIRHNQVTAAMCCLGCFNFLRKILRGS